MSKFSKTLLDILTELNNTSAEIKASAIISTDGLLMAALIDEDLDEDRVSAMTTAILAQANRVVREIQIGQLKQVLIKGRKGYTITVSAGDHAALTIILKKTSQLGFIFLCCNRSAKKIAATGIAKPGPRIGLVCLNKK